MNVTNSIINGLSVINQTRIDVQNRLNGSRLFHAGCLAAEFALAATYPKAVRVFLTSLLEAPVEVARDGLTYFAFQRSQGMGYLALSLPTSAK